MFSNPYHNLILFMILGLFFIGLATFIVGAVILIRRAASPDLEEISAQTAKLAQKGLAEDVAGLVGNVANLMDSMNQLARTSRGVGVILMSCGVIMMAGSCVFAYFVYQMNASPVPIG